MKRKLIYYSYVIIAPILILISLILTYRNYITEKENRTESNVESMENLISSVNVLQMDIKDISTYIAVNDDMMRMLKAENVEELNAQAQLWKENTPIEMIQDMIAIKGHIKTLAIYSERGIKPYLRGMDGSVYLQDMEDVHQSEIYQKTLANKNGMLWAYVGDSVGDVYAVSNSDKVVFCREIYNLSQKTRLCYIVIGLQGSYFENLCSSSLQGEDEGVLLVDPSGEVLSKAGNVPDEIFQYLTSESFLQSKREVGAEILEVDGYELICARASKDGTIACKILPPFTLAQVDRNITLTPIILTLAILIGILPILLWISRMVVNPLNKLSGAIQKLAEGDFTQQVPVTTDDEVGEVARCFNKMVTDIQQLIEENYVITLKEKESELQTLQAQINPHFLYNTLDSLYWQAMEADQEELAESILALSDLFRLVLTNGKKEVPMDVELRLVEKYLQIQKARFSQKLDYNIDLSSDAKNVLVPKLIVQPFVENAVVHGFEDMSGTCMVMVRVYLSNLIPPKERRASGDEYRIGTLRIEIEDTGAGMTPEQLAKLWEADEDPKYRRQRVGRFAIRNIRERLELKYHDDFVLEIKSEEGKGTMVIIEIPAMEAVLAG